MTCRERFHRTLAADPTVTRGPVMELVMWWDKTIEFWEEEGLPKGLSSLELYDYFGLDANINLWMPHRSPDCPAPKTHGGPLVESLDDYLILKRYLYPQNAVERMLPKIEEAKARRNNGDAVVWYTLDGFFWWPRTLFGIENHLYAFYDEPELYHRMCGDLLEWQLGVVEELARHIDADFMTIAEDMSYNLGPMLSEEHFTAFIAPYYRQLFPAVKKKGVRVILDSDGDISASMPWFVSAGVEGVFPLERQAGVDIAALQRRYPDFLWLCGFDKTTLLRDKDAIDAEFERIIPILRRGRYIPSVDHQTPPGVSLENYKYYVKRLREVSVQACKDC